MGNGCTSVPRGAPSRSSRTRSDHNSRGSHPPSSSMPPTQLCNHNVCSVLRRKDWDATEKMLVTGEGMDISLTKFLERALYEGCPTRLIEMIINKGASPLESTRCLSDAILGKVEYKMIKRLLDIGCSPNQESDQDKLKRTPMHFACQTPTPMEILDLLMERGGNVNLAVGERMWTPVHYLACANHDSAVLHRLIMQGGDINVRASDGTTPMAVAAFKRAPVEFFRTMLELGADPTIATRTARNPLYYIKNNEEPIVQPGDLRMILLDPKIHRNQMFALSRALHKRIGAKSEVRRLNPDILVHIGEFVMGKKSSKCEQQPEEEVVGGSTGE